MNSDQNTFTKTTSSGNPIVFNKTLNSVKNQTKITGMRDVTFTSSNDLILISTGFNNTELIYERYIENNGTNEFSVSLYGECYIEISLLNENLDIQDINISYSCSGSTTELIDSRLKFTYISSSDSYSVEKQANTFGNKDSNKTCLIPMYYDDGTNGKHPVTTIVNYGFSASYFTTIYLPSSITTINNGVFKQCEYLENIYLSDSITSIGAYAFTQCKKLTDIRLSENLLSIGDNAFDQCEVIESIYIPDSVITVGSSLFVKCYKIKTVNCPKGVKTLKSSTFYYDDVITDFTYTINVKDVGYHFFRDCDNIENISYEGTVEQWKKLSNYKAFYTNCPKITKVTCSDGDYTL